MKKILGEAQAEIDRIETSSMNVESYAMSIARLQVLHSPRTLGW